MDDYAVRISKLHIDKYDNADKITENTIVVSVVSSETAQAVMRLVAGGDG